MEISSEMKDLWGQLPTKVEYNRSLDILREQANLITQKTDRLIHGSVIKVNYTSTTSATVSVLKAISQTINKSYEYETVEGDSDDIESLTSKTDANTLFKKTEYQFLVVNDEFRFRILILEYSEEYPVIVNADEGICEEQGIEPQIKVFSNKEFESILSRILQSNKMKRIISRMVEEKQEVYAKEIIKYISNTEDFTIKKMAEDMNWSVAMTKKRLQDLVIKGMLKEETIGKGKKRYIIFEQ